MEEPPDEGWSPEGDKLPDEFMKEATKHLKRMSKAEDEAADLPSQMMQYRTPTFKEASEMCDKAWKEVVRLATDAPDGVQSIMFQSLLQAVAGEASQAKIHSSKQPSAPETPSADELEELL